MSLRRVSLQGLPLLAGVGLATLWPLSAYIVSPVLLPGLLVGCGVVAIVLFRPELGIAIAVALSPLTNVILHGSKPFQFLLPALAFGIAIYAALAGVRRRELGSSHGLSMSVLLFLAVGVASSAQAIDPAASVKKTVILLSGAALYLAVVQVCQDSRKLVTVGLGAVAALFVAGAHGFAQHSLGTAGVAGFVVNGTLVTRVQGSFGHPNQYGGYLAFLIPVAVAVLFSRGFRPLARWFALVAIGLGLAGLVFSYARGAILGLFVGSVVWLAVLRPRMAVAAAVAVAVAAVLFAPATLRQRFNPQAASADAPIRTDIWGAALDIASQHPWLGVGVNNFPVAYKALPTTQLSFATQRRYLDQTQYLTPPHAQNLYLNVLAEEGVVGLGALVFLLGAATVVLFRGSKVADPAGRAICMGAGAGLMTLLVHSTLEVTLTTELAIPFFALVAVAGTLVALDRREAVPASASSA
jgi:O-antigen ligase